MGDVDAYYAAPHIAVADDCGDITFLPNIFI